MQNGDRVRRKIGLECEQGEDGPGTIIKTNDLSGFANGLRIDVLFDTGRLGVGHSADLYEHLVGS